MLLSMMDSHKRQRVENYNLKSVCVNVRLTNGRVAMVYFDCQLDEIYSPIYSWGGGLIG